MGRKITIELSDTQEAAALALHDGVWSDDPKFWSDVLDWGLEYMAVLKRDQADNDADKKPPPDPDGIPF